MRACTVTLDELRFLCIYFYILKYDGIMTTCKLHLMTQDTLALCSTSSFELFGLHNCQDATQYFILPQ